VSELDSVWSEWVRFSMKCVS